MRWLGDNMTASSPDLRVPGRPGDAGWLGGTDHDPLGVARDGLHRVVGEAAQQLRPRVLILRLGWRLLTWLVINGLLASFLQD